MEINTINLDEKKEASSSARPELLEAMKTASVLALSAVAFVTVLAVWFASAFPEKSDRNNNNAEVERIDVTAGLNSASPVVEAETSSNSANREVMPEIEATGEVVLGKQITNAQQLDQLQQKLYDAIDLSWKIPVSATSVYSVRVDETGEVASYQPLSQSASENAENTPLSGLVTSKNPVAGENPQTDFAEFEVSFSDVGGLEVRPQRSP